MLGSGSREEEASGLTLLGAGCKAKLIFKSALACASFFRRITRSAVSSNSGNGPDLTAFRSDCGHAPPFRVAPRIFELFRWLDIKLVLLRALRASRVSHDSSSSQIGLSAQSHAQRPWLRTVTCSSIPRNVAAAAWALNRFNMQTLRGKQCAQPSNLVMERKHVDTPCCEAGVFTSYPALTLCAVGQQRVGAA